MAGPVFVIVPVLQQVLQPKKAAWEPRRGRGEFGLLGDGCRAWSQHHTSGPRAGGGSKGGRQPVGGGSWDVLVEEE